MSKKIYCIARGDWEDWHIYYSFESEEKRDKLLEVMHNTDNDYHKYDLELKDGDIEMDKIKNVYFVDVYNGENNIYIHPKIYYSLDNEVCKLNVCLDENELYSIHLPITKEEYLAINDNEDKYIKIFNDYKAKVKYMREVEGMSIDEIEELLNK